VQQKQEIFMRMLAYLVAIICLSESPASAQQVVYTPVNPAFGGSSFNYNYLQGTADAQNQFKNKPQATSKYDYNQQFIQQLQTMLYSSLAQKVSSTISNCTSTCAGSITLGDQKVTYSNDGTTITLMITDSTGKVTTISVPSFSN
jgi:curli production assembly/transport component CsgF